MQLTGRQPSVLKSPHLALWLGYFIGVRRGHDLATELQSGPRRRLVRAKAQESETHLLMPGGPRHHDHVYRVLGLFAAGFAAFVVFRYFLVPPDFGVYGFYRAGALDDARARTPLYAGETLCLDCHSDVGDVRKTARHAKLRCEACHGALAAHASGNVDAKPPALNPRLLCLRCHTTQAGQPSGFPNIVPADHAGEVPCVDCHKPHRPKID